MGFRWNSCLRILRRILAIPYDALYLRTLPSLAWHELRISCLLPKFDSFASPRGLHAGARIDRGGAKVVNEP